MLKLRRVAKTESGCWNMKKFMKLREVAETWRYYYLPKWLLFWRFFSVEVIISLKRPYSKVNKEHLSEWRESGIHPISACMYLASWLKIMDVVNSVKRMRERMPITKKTEFSYHPLLCHTHALHGCFWNQAFRKFKNKKNYLTEEL